MATVRTHTTAKGFCLCHLLSVWQVTGRLCLYLGYYNLSYIPQQSKFVCGEQLYMHAMAIVNLIGSFGYLLLSKRWIYDQYIFLLFVPLYIYYLLLRQHLTKLLNECAGIHRTLQRMMGDWLCVSIRKECVLMLLLPLELLLLLGWHFCMYNSYQFCFIAGIAFIYYMQLLFLGNYLIWLASIYRALNEFLRQHMSSSRVGILSMILKQQVSMWALHERIIRYFALHFFGFVALIVLRFGQLLLGSKLGNQLRFDRLQFVHLILLVILLIIFIITGYNLQQQRLHFDYNFLQLQDRLEYFGLKSWRLLSNQRRLMPFNLPISMRSSLARTTQPKKDVISMLFNSNLPVTQLCQRSLPLASLCLGPHQLQLTLPMLLGSLIKVVYMVLLSLGMHLLQHTHSHTQIEFYSCYTKSNFDVNVIQTISHVYRYYQYDELNYIQI